MQELERWLDEATDARWTNSPEEGELLRPVAEQRIRQLAAVPEEAMPVLLHAIENADKAHITTAFEVVHAIGYPKNAAAIPYLLYFLADPNFPGGMDVVGALREMDPKVLLPSIIRVFLRQAPFIPYTGNEVSETDWEEMATGCCYYLRDIAERSAAQLCSPAINFFLSHTLATHPERKKGFLYLVLDILEKVGTPAYFLPALVLLAEKQAGNNLGKHAEQLIHSFTEEQLAPYRSLLPF